MGDDEKVGQQLALTGDLGRVYPSKGLRISGFAQRIGLKGLKVATQQKRNKTRKTARERLTKQKKETLTYYSTAQGLPVFN